jgi:DNA modification methylase
MTIINADCLDWMKSQPDNSIDCLITDPPYVLKFMGKKKNIAILPRKDSKIVIFN